eukprot:366460-Chlamydomonas_euryale.AAC.7
MAQRARRVGARSVCALVRGIVHKAAACRATLAGCVDRRRQLRWSKRHPGTVHSVVHYACCVRTAVRNSFAGFVAACLRAVRGVPHHAYGCTRGRCRRLVLRRRALGASAGHRSAPGVC